MIKKKTILNFILINFLLIGCSTSGIISDLLEALQEDAGREPAGLENRQEDDERFSNVDGIACIPDIDTYEIAYVTRVIDGDSIEVEINGEVFQVRYIGINTPEYYSSQQRQAVTATQANEELVEGKIVYLFKDQSETDKYDRLLRYVLTEDDFVNLELVRAGYAEAREYHPDTACHAVFEQVE
jgi:endonuclease YncB( thermonuclease family)